LQQRFGPRRAVQKIARERLEEIEASAKLMLDENLEKVKAEIEEVKEVTDREIEEVKSAPQEENLAQIEELVKEREEIEGISQMMFLGETRYRELKSGWGQVFRADMGAEAFYDILQRLDLAKLSEELWEEVRTTKSKQRRKKATKRLTVVEAFRRSGNKPEWMILTVLPVIPETPTTKGSQSHESMPGQHSIDYTCHVVSQVKLVCLNRRVTVIF